GARGRLGAAHTLRRPLVPGPGPLSGPAPRVGSRRDEFHPLVAGQQWQPSVAADPHHPALALTLAGDRALRPSLETVDRPAPEDDLHRAFRHPPRAGNSRAEGNPGSLG